MFLPPHPTQSGCHRTWMHVVGMAQVGLVVIGFKKAAVTKMLCLCHASQCDPDFLFMHSLCRWL